MSTVDELAEKFGQSKIAEALRIQVVGGRLLVDVESGKVRGYAMRTANSKGRTILRMRIDGYYISWDPETDTVVWAGGRGQ